MTKKKNKVATKPSSKAQTPELSFEQSLEKLELIVRQLEDGGLELGESLAQYEQGVKHLKACYAALRKAERKIELLAGVDADGRPLSEPFDDAEQTVEEKRKTRSSRRSRPVRSGPADDSPSAGDDIDEPKGLF